MAGQNKPISVLVVDDDPFTLETLKVVLETDEMEVEACGGGREAIETLMDLQTSHFDCILTDYRMPDVTGLDLLAWVQEHDPSLATIILTAEGEKTLVTSSLRSGACDFLEKPFKPDEIRDSVRKGCQITHQRRELSETASEVREITTVQRKLTELASHLSTGGDTGNVYIANCLFPIKETGGDFSKYTMLDDGRLFVQVGDVSGHDLKAGFISAYFQGIVHGMMEMNAGIDKVCDFFNRFLIFEWNDRLSPSEIITALATCFVVFDFQRKRIEVLNSGFPIPFMVGEGLTVRQAGESGPPLGWFDPLESTAQEYPLEPFGYCYLWSDGLEDMSKELGVSPFAMAHQIVHTPQEVLEQTLLRGRKDDVAVIRVGWGEELAVQSEDQNLAVPIYGENFRGDTASKIDAYQKCWEKSVRMCVPEMPESRLHEISLCCREAVLNGLVHGCKASPTLHCSLAIGLCQKSPDTLVVRIHDEGPGYEEGEQDPVSFEDETGHVSLGLVIIQSYSQSFFRLDSGSTLLLTFNIQKEEEVNAG